MMKKTNKKRGFTIIELTIVVAVIAILSAVLIPTFAAIIKKSRESADQQAVRSMNTALAAETITDDLNIFDVFEVLEDNGMDGQNYKSLAKDKAFFYDAEIKRVLYVNTATDTAVYPEEYAGRTNNGKWYSLTMEIEAVKPADSDYSNGGATVTVDSGKELNYVLEKINDNKSNVNTIELAGTVDMMGAELNIAAVKSNLTIKGTDSNPVVIKNATAVEAKTTYKNPTGQQDGNYNCALVTSVASGQTLKLENIIIENTSVKDVNASNAAFLVGTLSGTLELSNVTIKNSTIIGHHNVGALIGNMGAKNAKLVISGPVNLENLSVQNVGGRSGMLIGNIITKVTPTITGTSKITMTNCTSSIYYCEQNTGTYEGNILGLVDGNLWSTEIISTGAIEYKSRPFFENTLIGNLANTTEVTSYAALKALVA